MTQTKFLPLYTTIREWSKHSIEDADLMRRGVQSLTANRQTLNPAGDTAIINDTNMRLYKLTEAKEEQIQLARLPHKMTELAPAILSEDNIKYHYNVLTQKAM